MTFKFFNFRLGFLLGGLSYLLRYLNGFVHKAVLLRWSYFDNRLLRRQLSRQKLEGFKVGSRGWCWYMLLWLWSTCRLLVVELWSWLILKIAAVVALSRNYCLGLVLECFMERFFCILFLFLALKPLQGSRTQLKLCQEFFLRRPKPSRLILIECHWYFTLKQFTSRSMPLKLQICHRPLRDISKRWLFIFWPVPYFYFT